MVTSEKQTLKSGHTVSLADGHGLMNWWEIAWTIDLPTDNWLTERDDRPTEKVTV